MTDCPGLMLQLCFIEWDIDFDSAHQYARETEQMAVRGALSTGAGAKRTKGIREGVSVQLEER